ncbi:alpha/beta fold hydrolase [Chengkuizengella axinellae]|uniref:Alpha/beta hydrolase n=1 Tax=Chengkuizengella axinellae TaxID=3064388 RepID=A0ABT9IW59_9BACL|nr:alpha/beta hydrolase [Chengkuizengella sp. 2205SS18-9]MDP5273593.1 alpha/beta hydrolase [Chengkuizengella sp. 2205SS18-9]
MRDSIKFKTMQKQEKYYECYDASLSLWKVPFEAYYVNTEQGDTHIISCGNENGEPLVLLHAMGCSSTMWYPNIQELSKHFKIYAVDYFGDLNKSIPINFPSQMAQCTTWFKQVLDALHIEKCYLAGLSYGGFLSTQFSLSIPHRIKKLILMNPAGTFAQIYNRFIVRILTLAQFPNRFVVNNFINWLSVEKNAWNKLLVSQFHAGFKYGMMKGKIPPFEISDEDLTKLEVPTLLLLGEGEVICDVQKAYHRASNLVKNIQVELVPSAGHLLSLEKPEYVNQQMIKFFVNH